jgi:tetratricopeptide (TPR) repeat protein
VTGWEVARIEELDAIPVAEGLVWRPVRRRFGIESFGVNAYTAEGVGGHVVEEHDESGSGAGRHEELYVVISGRARFTVDGEAVDAPAGTLVYVRDPALTRGAIAEEEGTVVLAVGGEPGHAYEISPWEFTFIAMPLLRAERWSEAIELLQEGLLAHPGNASILYNLACADSRAGRTLDALMHLQEAVRANPAYAENARTDPDFDAIRREPGFPA